MDLDILSQYSRQVKAMMEATTSSDVQEALDRLVEDEQWNLLSHLLPTATELAARRTVDQLLEHNQYEPLAWAACLRRPMIRLAETGPIPGTRSSQARLARLTSTGKHSG